MKRMSDKILITKDALAETIRCTICQNSNKTERGCDGSCQYDKELYEKITEAVMGLAEQRPHGEWIDEGVYADNAGQHVYRCTYCEEHIVEYPSELGSYCKYCGSDNRKSGEAE